MASKAKTIGELKEMLYLLPDHLPIIWAIDEEGNGYHWLNYTPSTKLVHKDEAEQWRIDNVYDVDDVDLDTELDQYVNCLLIN